MNIFLVKQIELHPEMEPQDVIKQCFQSAFGAEHILTDLQRAEDYLYLEFESTEAEDILLTEDISDKFCRVNIAAWKYRNLSKKLLFDAFTQSGKTFFGEKTAERGHVEFRALMREYEITLKSVWNEEKMREFTAFVDAYYEQGIRPVHHSEIYRTAYNPHYRVVAAELLNRVN